MNLFVIGSIVSVGIGLIISVRNGVVLSQIRSLVEFKNEKREIIKDCMQVAVNAILENKLPESLDSSKTESDTDNLLTKEN